MGLNNFRTTAGAAEFTNVELTKSLGFPSGYEIGEDNGDLVVRDTNGTIALRRVDGGNWSFEGNTVETGALQADSADVTNQVTSNSVDTANLQSDSITNTGTITSESVDPQFLADDYIYSASFSGSSPDDRLDKALSQANPGQMLILANETYSKNRTIDTDIHIRGTASHARGTEIAGSWTYTTRCTLDKLNISSSHTLTGFTSSVINCTGSGSIEFQANVCRAIGLAFIDVEFSSNASNGIVDSCANVSVVDNGANTVGDIS
jgi:hypothetical protein